MRIDGNQVGLEFLKNDLEMAFTFLQLASTSDDTERVTRCLREARKAYDTVVRMVQRVEISEAEKGSLQKKIARVKSELQRFGESF